jgi:hypothetical protein
MVDLLETAISLVPLVNPVNVLKESSAGLELPNVPQSQQTRTVSSNLIFHLFRVLVFSLSILEVSYREEAL